jgi:hypothetical protein
MGTFAGTVSGACSITAAKIANHGGDRDLPEFDGCASVHVAKTGEPSLEDPMSILMRQIHRWLSIAFTLPVIANFVAMTQGQPPAWVTYSPLVPLAFLLLTGWYLFALPYLTKLRSARHTRRVGD